MRWEGALLVLVTGCATGIGDSRGNATDVSIAEDIDRVPADPDEGPSAIDDSTGGGPTNSGMGSSSDGPGVDTDCTPSSWWADEDGDGYGDPDQMASACEPPEGHVSVADDCDDTNADVFPGQTEQCDGQDTDCDGFTDEWSEANGSCNGCDLLEYNGHGYAVCTGAADWATARDACVSDFGGALYEDSDQNEHDTIVGIASGIMATNYWIAASDLDQEGTFVWLDGDPIDWSLWEMGQPDDYMMEEDCVELRNSFTYNWNDQTCSQQLSWICELE